jgi:hypothetical protein
MLALRTLSRPRPFADAIRDLSSAREPACLLDLEGTVVFANEAWDRFAVANGGGPGVLASAIVGTRWLDHVQGEEPRRLHAILLERAFGGEGTGPGGALVQVSEANGPVVARLVATHLEPIRVQGGALVGLAVVHRVVRELPAAEVYAPVEGTAADYRDGAGLLEQCSCCRRTRRPGAPADAEWDFVPALVTAPPRDVRWDYCPLCVELHDAAGTGFDRC